MFLKISIKVKDNNIGHDYILYSLIFGGDKMLINFYMKFLLLLLTTLVYFNLFILVKDAIFVMIYPYLLGFTALFIIFLLMLQFFENAVIIKIIYVIMTLFFIFFMFTFFQIWKNTRALNGYQVKRSNYMDQLTEIDKNKRMIDVTLEQSQQGIGKLIEENTGMPISFYNEALLIYDGITIFDEIVEEISKAKSHIHIEFFILRSDNIGRKLKDLLIKKAKEGVEVRVIYDGLGSWSLKRHFRKELIEAGVEIKAYDNIFQSVIKGKLNHRNHRKIVIVDGKVGFTGGINIGDEYLGRDNTIGNWKDILVKIKGEAVKGMQRVFLGDWYYVSGDKLLDNKYFPEWEGENILPVQIVSGGYDTYWNEISQAYFSIITSAKKRLYIATPYLVLSDSMINALQTAALKGVDVKIIIPKNPDLFLVGWANSSFFNKLLNSKVKIYLYEDGFIHSKVFVADDKVVSVGSANLNTRSQYLDYEMNAILFDHSQSELMIKELYKNIEDSDEVILEDYRKRPLIQRFKEKIGMLMIPLI